MTRENESPRLLVLGAHPDDAEFHAGGLAARYAHLGRAVRLVSVTNGGAGHHQLSSTELSALRREEAGRAGRVIGADYVTWDFEDGHLQPTLEVRNRIIQEIREFQPDLVLTHRTCDYHPDHRAVGQAVQDASYLVTVPLVCPEAPILRRDPVVAYMVDLFTKPYPLTPDVVLDVNVEMEMIVAMLAEHRSQVFEFLPFNQGIEASVPKDEQQRLTWLAQWYQQIIAPRTERFREAVIDRFGQTAAQDVRWIEAYEISEYASQIDATRRRQLFCE